MTPNENIQKACAALAEGVAQLLIALQDRKPLNAPPPFAEVELEGDEGSASSMRPEQGSLVESAASERRLYVYMAGARGLANLARANGHQIAATLNLANEAYVVKCGTTTIPLEARLRQIGQDRYGAALRTQDGIVAEPGFTRWIAHVIATSRKPRDPAVTLLPRAIAVDLPTGLTRRAFDTSLHRALKERALDSLPASVLPKRYVAYDLVETRLNVAKELYALSPHESGDGDLLIDAIEDILSRFRAGKT